MCSCWCYKRVRTLRTARYYYVDHNTSSPFDLQKQARCPGSQKLDLTSASVCPCARVILHRTVMCGAAETRVDSKRSKTYGTWELVP